MHKFKQPIISSEQMGKVESVEPFGHSGARKIMKKCHILTIFPVLGKLTHICTTLHFLSKAWVSKSWENLIWGFECLIPSIGLEILLRWFFSNTCVRTGKCRGGQKARVSLLKHSLPKWTIQTSPTRSHKARILNSFPKETNSFNRIHPIEAFS